MLGRRADGHRFENMPVGGGRIEGRRLCREEPPREGAAVEATMEGGQAMDAIGVGRAMDVIKQSMATIEDRAHARSILGQDEKQWKKKSRGLFRTLEMKVGGKNLRAGVDFCSIRWL